MPLGGHSVGHRTLSPTVNIEALPIEVQGRFASRFTTAQGETVLMFRGGCSVRQGDRLWTAPALVLWEMSAPEAVEHQYLAYLESTPEESATVHIGEKQDRLLRNLVELTTTGPMVFNGKVSDVADNSHDPLYQRAATQRHANGFASAPTSYTVNQNPGGPFLPPPPGGMTVIPSGPAMPGIRRHVTIGPRFLGERLEFKVEQTRDVIPSEYTVTVTGGVNIVVDNVPLKVDGRTILTRIDLTADRAVVWTSTDRAGNMGSFEIDENTPFQVYLEGNIVVRQGSNTFSASHSFFDVNQRRGLMLNAEVRSMLPDFDGTLRLRASEIRQFSESNYHARDAWITTSKFGQPKWRLQANDIHLEERVLPGARIDPKTGQPRSMLWVTSRDSMLYAEQTPILPLPYISGPAEDPHIPIRKLNIGYSGVNGLEFESLWNLEGIFNMNLPAGVDWQLEVNEYTERGPALGTRTEYDFASALFGRPVRHRGHGQLIYQYDKGKDNLGLGRRNLPVPGVHRGRALLRNRTDLTPNTWLQADIGHIFNNDRNYYEQFYENEWDTDKDLENALSLHNQYDNWSSSLLVSGRSNDFENQTNWLPKIDLTILSEPVFGSPLMWSSHSSVGYGQSRAAQAPNDPVADPFAPLPYYQNVGGAVAMSRHELSLPFNVGPVKVVPYAQGEIAHWGEDLTGQELTRLYGSAGVRASIQFSKYMPHVHSQILGLNGLAHKVVYDLDYHIAQSNVDFDRVPQYNEFDDNAQERFRSRFIPIEFGGTLPAIYNPRNYAVRSGAGRSVTAPYHELVDDQQVLWMGMRHRWQTKVGPPENPRVIDWMELDLGAALFPNADRDNFGEDLGLITGRYAWHVGPRTSLLANGTMDLFDDGQKVWNVGMLTQRSARGSMYLGYREVQAGAIDSKLITGSFSYVLSPNLYVATFGTSFDIADGIDRGQSLTLTRIGEYYLIHFGVGYDRSRDNVGAAISFEPKFGGYGNGSMQLNSLLGIR